jgi:phosphatidylglycerol:prolipoprotein diacylglycerol transferase
MIPYLFHLYGPIYVNCYGLMIAIGILVFSYFLLKNPKTNLLIGEEALLDTILLSTIVGIIGGRILWVFSNWPIGFYEIIAIWDGGLSVLGSIIAILSVMPIYFKKKSIKTLELLDLAAIYAPLLQAISRVGCFLAGCCYGLPTKCLLGIKYTHPDVAIPNELKNIAIHPTQLYSALVLFIIFLMMHYLFSKYFKKPGQLISIYLMLSALERFLVDFWRGDKEFLRSQNLYFSNINYLTIHQWLALIIFIGGLLLFLKKSKTNKECC